MRAEMAAMERRLLAAVGSAAQAGGKEELRADGAAVSAPGLRPVAAVAAPRLSPGMAPPGTAGDGWRVARSRAARKKEKKMVKSRMGTADSSPPVQRPTSKRTSRQRQAPPLDNNAAGRQGKKGAQVLQRPPRTAAVTLTAAPDAKITYAEAMAAAREKISLAEIGIEGVRPKTSKTGGLILEIRGPGGQEKAQQLAVRMAGVLEGSGVRVSRPTKTGELRIRGLDVSTKPHEVAAAVAAVGGCPEGSVRVGDVEFGPLGQGAAWVRCPLDAAHRVARAGRLTVGWCSAHWDKCPI